MYEPTVQREAASRSALQRIIRTFFDGSAKEAVAALLDPAAFRLSKKGTDELARDDRTGQEGEEVVMLEVLSDLRCREIQPCCWRRACLCLRFLREADAAMRHSVCLVALVRRGCDSLLALWSPQWSIVISDFGGGTGSIGGQRRGASAADWPTLRVGRLGHRRTSDTLPVDRRSVGAGAGEEAVSIFLIREASRFASRMSLLH